MLSMVRSALGINIYSYSRDCGKWQALKKKRAGNVVFEHLERNLKLALKHCLFTEVLYRYFFSKLENFSLNLGGKR